MRKTIDGKDYYLPSNLTLEQEEIYCHIIDWKRDNVTKERGVYKGNEYDALFPDNPEYPRMLYRAIVPELQEMQKGKFAFKQHKFAFHAVSSQTACINLFMPVLLSSSADEILKRIPGRPAEFEGIDRDKLYNGFCFEYWGQDILQGKGLLNDHSSQAGTDADVAIAYRDGEGDTCLWLIEHKLSEKEFTECGGYKSASNTHKEFCRSCSFEELISHPNKCHYHNIGYKYWDYLKKDVYNGSVDVTGCPFRGGLNQLWRNQMLAFALQESGTYKKVTFSVCHHYRNSMLNQSMSKYKSLISNNEIFSQFTNLDIINSIISEQGELTTWLEWYKSVYCI